MRLRVTGALLAGVAAFTLAACNDQSESDTSEQPAQQVEVEFDFDSTKTKTVVIPPSTLPTYRPSTPVTTKRPPAATTKPKVTR